MRAGIIEPRASVVAYVTGNGLKDIKAAIECSRGPIDVAPDINAVASLLSSGR